MLQFMRFALFARMTFCVVALLAIGLLVVINYRNSIESTDSRAEVERKRNVKDRYYRFVMAVLIISGIVLIGSVLLAKKSSTGW